MSASILEDVAKSAKLMRRRMEPVATCGSSFKEGIPSEPRVPRLVVSVPSSTTAVFSWLRSMENGERQLGHGVFVSSEPLRNEVM